MKETTPFGKPAPGDTGATVAIKFTGEADKAGLTLDTSAVVVLAWWTCRDRVLDVEPMKLVSPPYTAVTLCFDPTASVEVV
jgi:hypothetical protein